MYSLSKSLLLLISSSLCLSSALVIDKFAAEDSNALGNWHGMYTYSPFVHGTNCLTEANQAATRATG